MSEASIRTQWKKGQSGNPRGRPKTTKNLPDQGQMLTQMARLMLDQPCYVQGNGDQQITRMTRLMLDVLERAERGELACIKYLFELADRGDRRKLQALRAGRRAKDKDDAAFERRMAHAIKAMPPALKPGQEFAIAYSRPRRTEQVKVKPEPRTTPRGDNPYARQPDPFHQLMQELRDKEQEEERLARIAAQGEREANASEQARAREKTGAETGRETGFKTGPFTGLSTGLRHVFGPRQTIGDADLSAIRLRDDETFDLPPPPHGINGAHLNGSHNGSHAPR